ncbi:Uu.00g136560.m01.CDS01 [Anthostomella pinea]|uniref:Uu.00g136560.m01.CDS01 n=1 Tax=Anthostomella pinea TaxID=933095 RepID=A0AAI8VPE6_9PEZI|nr:Uu.00g136560.m01.CDS01 [Anthostomella pinea]
MAVLTKPDLAIERNTQQIAIDHVMGKRSELTLGYYIVKNRGPDDANKSLEQGQTDERSFFAKAPWLVLNSTGKAGMDALKLRVRDRFPQHLLEEGWHPLVEILDVHTELLVNDDPFGQVTSGHLRV